MFKSLAVKILVPIVALMVALGASLYFGVLRTVNDFAQQNIAKDLDNLTHDLFNMVDREYMNALKSIKGSDTVEVRISQVDSLDLLEGSTISRDFLLIIFEEQSGVIRLASDLPGEILPYDIINRFRSDGQGILQLDDDAYYMRHLYFSPWDWHLLILKNTHTYDTLTSQVEKVYILSVIALVLATALLVLYLLRSIKQPIESIVSSVSRGRSPDYKGTNEFEFLGDSIGRMMTSLNEEVAERRRAEIQAEEANRAKSEFLANMSHELRTPLNAILGFAQIMEKNKSLDLANLRTIQRSGHHLLTLINQILDLSKIEAGRLTVEKNCFDLHHLFDELKSMLQLKAGKKGISLSFAIDSNVPNYICTDDVKLRQVLINLMSNAIKFTREGSVTMRVARSEIDAGDNPANDPLSLSSSFQADCRLDFAVEDTGSGIDPKEIDNLFEPFTQTTSGKMAGVGTGLGLIISKRFVELLGGSMNLTSEPGKGSIFSFSIPVLEVERSYARSAWSVTQPVGVEPGQPAYRILIVDDSRDNRELLIRFLEPLGFPMREAENGLEAIEIQQAWEPHLILMDIRMPVLDGLEAARRIWSRQADRRWPVIIMVTAHVLQSTMQKLRDAGFADMLIKPFREHELFELLRKHLKLRFIYASRAQDAVLEPDVSPASPLAAAASTSLPEDIITRLKRAIVALRMDATLELIHEIRDYNAPLADTLQQLVQDYRFDTIEEILEQKDTLEVQQP